MSRADVLEMFGILLAFVAVGLIIDGVHQVMPWLAQVIAGVCLLTVALLLVGIANGAQWPQRSAPPVIEPDDWRPVR